MRKTDACAPSLCRAATFVVVISALGIIGALGVLALVVAMTLTVLGLWAE